MKDKKQQPSYLLEFPHPLRLMVMRRGHLLRTIKTRGLVTLLKVGSSSWLLVRIKLAADQNQKETWDFAHELSRLVKLELNQEIYVEPASKIGQYHKLTHSANSGVAYPGPDSHLVSRRAQFESFASGPNFSTAVSGSGATLNSPALSLPSLNQSNNSTVHCPHLATMPKLPAEQLQNMAKTDKIGVDCPALHDLPGWSDLTPVKQRMFETEAAQLIKNGLAVSPDMSGSEHSTILLLRFQPTASKALKAFLAKALQPVLSLPA